MAICSRCIVPENFPKNEMHYGICSFCRLNEEKLGNKSKVNRETELLSMLKNTNHDKYDCIVPVSGGKDSTYILYYLVKNLKLNPLAFYFDNGYATDDAIHNVEEICRKMNVDLVKRPASKYRMKLIREAWFISLYTGKISNFCGNCENNLRTTAIQEALKHNIKNIVWGSTDYEDSPDSFLNPVSSRSYRNSFAGNFNLKRISTLYRKSVGWLFPEENISAKAKLKALIHRFMYLHYYVMDNISQNAPEGLKKFSPYLQVSFQNKKTRTFYFYDYIPYDPINQIKILQEKAGWKAPSGRQAKMDCALHYISNFGDLKQTGITNSGFKLSVLVRNGLISREEAMMMEKKEVEFVKSYFRSEDLEIGPALQVIKDEILKNQDKKAGT